MTSRLKTLLPLLLLVSPLTAQDPEPLSFEEAYRVAMESKSMSESDKQLARFEYRIFAAKKNDTNWRILMSLTVSTLSKRGISQPASALIPTATAAAATCQRGTDRFGKFVSLMVPFQSRVLSSPSMRPPA